MSRIIPLVIKVKKKEKEIYDSGQLDKYAPVETLDKGRIQLIKISDIAAGVRKTEEFNENIKSLIPNDFLPGNEFKH